MKQPYQASAAEIEQHIESFSRMPVGGIPR